MKVVVVGGGLAGLAAALELVEEAEVTLLEARPTLGGAVQTLPERDGDPDPPPDNGQHIALGCFTSYQRFLERIGTLDALRREGLDLPVIDERGRVSHVRPGAFGLLRYGHVSPAGRLRIAKVARRLGREIGEEDYARTFADVLRAYGQREIEIDRFWDVFIRPALNLRSAEAAAHYGIFTVQQALLSGEAGASDLLLPTRPLGEMHGDAAGRALAEAGAEVRTGVRVAALDDGAAVLADGERVAADWFVVAVPPDEAARMLDRPARGYRYSPIVSVHLLFDRVVLDHPLAALLDSPAHWVFDRGRLTGRVPEHGQYLTVVSSGAPELLELRGRELVETIVSAVTARLGPAELVWSRVSREPRATVAQAPLGRSFRPVAPKRKDVVLAATWNSGPWPATMEGAIRCGRHAANQVLVETPEYAR